MVRQWIMARSQRAGKSKGEEREREREGNAHSLPHPSVFFLLTSLSFLALSHNLNGCDKAKTNAYASYISLRFLSFLTQMQNYLHCNQCDGKHRRYSTDRFVLTARYCSRCNTRHAAKEVRNHNVSVSREKFSLPSSIHFSYC